MDSGMRISVLGSGCVGLVSAVCFADLGHSVVCVDVDRERISRLSAGDMPLFEPGLAELVRENVDAGRLAFSCDVDASTASSDVVFIAVGTVDPNGDGRVDLSQVYDAAESIGRAMRGFTVVVNKSTVPVGTGEAVERIIRDVNPSADFVVVSNPEFLREGNAIGDFQTPDRVVIGADDERGRLVMSNVYSSLVSRSGFLVFVSRRTAELIKYAANAYLAMKISYINEMADLCEAVECDVTQVALGIGLDRRIGTEFLNAGPGYGGSCLPKDTRVLARIGRDNGSPMALVETAIEINEKRKSTMVAKVIAACEGTVLGKKVAVLGLTFKADTDDVRVSPALSIIGDLQENGARVAAYDPRGTIKGPVSAVEFGAHAYDIAKGACALVIVTEWHEFRSLDLERLGALMADRVIVDFRNIYQHDEVERHGFTYHCVGRPKGRATGPAEIAPRPAGSFAI